MIEQPPGIKILLKQHQRTLAHRCIALENGTINFGTGISGSSQIGIMCDKVGAGKSYTMLSIILMNDLSQRSKTRQLIFSNDFASIYKSMNYTTNLKTSVIVVPENITHQWISYLDNTTLNYFVIDSVKSRELYNNSMENRLLDVLIVLVARVAFFAYGNWFSSMWAIITFPTPRQVLWCYCLVIFEFYSRGLGLTFFG